MSENKKTDSCNRRQFIARTTRAGFSIAAVSTAGYFLHDPQGPTPYSKKNNITELPDFRVPALPGKSLSIVTGENRIKTVRRGIDLLGGIEHFIKPGDVVGIKPNIGFATPPMLGATTNSELVAEVVRLCFEQGKAKKVLVLDNPINNPTSCFSLSGIQAACETVGAQMILPREHLFADITLKKASLIRDWPVFYEPLTTIDKLIGIAPVKHHHRSGASMTMKNWYGLLGGRRNIFHQNINTIIAELAMMVKPTFVILDGTQIMITNGPTGGSLSDLKRQNTIITGCDHVSVDTIGCSLLGLKPADLPFLEKAERLGAGTTDYQSHQPIYEDMS